MIGVEMKGPKVTGPKAESVEEIAMDTTETLYLEVEGGAIAYDDTGGDGPLVARATGVGDLRVSYRFLKSRLVEVGPVDVELLERAEGERRVG